MNMCIFTNMLQFLISKCKAHPMRGERPHFKKFGPVYTLALGSGLIMCDLTRHLVNDAWGTHCDEASPGQYAGLPSKYEAVCYSTAVAAMYGPDGKLNTLGVLFTLVFTWTGFLLLLIGIFWGIDFHRKIRLHWRIIQEGRDRGTHQEHRDQPLLTLSA